MTLFCCRWRCFGRGRRGTRLILPEGGVGIARKLPRTVIVGYSRCREWAKTFRSSMRTKRVEGLRWLWIGMKEETATCPVFDPPDMYQHLWQEMDDAFEDSKIKSIWPSVLLLAMRPRQNTSDLGCGLYRGLTTWSNGNGPLQPLSNVLILALH